MKKITFLLFFLAFLTKTTAQTDSTIQEIQALFPDVKLQSVKHYKGRMDDVSDVNISLGSDGKFCRGYMTYLRSQEKFLLEGTFLKDTLILKEFDANKKNTGVIKGFIQGKKIDATWGNYNGTIGGILLKMNETLEPSYIPSFCADNKWVRGYRGAFEDFKIDILLQKGSFGNASGTGYFIKDGKSFQLKGTYNEAKLSLDLVIKDDFGNKLGTLTLRQKGANEFVGSFLSPDGKKHYGDLIRNDNIDMGCMEFADYIASYDITYPRFPNPEYNLWMQTLVDEWFRVNIAYINSLRFDNLDNVPEVRNVARAYGWCDVSYYSPELFSGFMVYGNSWTNRQRERSFIYDFVANREIIFDDIFKANSAAEAFIKAEVQKGLKSHLLYPEQDFKDWIAIQKFDNMAIRNEGIYFSSSSMAYGRQGVTIPYTTLIPYLNPSGSVWVWANRKK